MKNVIRYFIILGGGLSAALSFGQVPDHFKKVDQTIWIVENLDSVIFGWKQLGFNQISDLGTLEADLESSNTPVEIKIAKANLGGANITWIQPLGGKSAFSEFHKGHGDGAMSLIYRLHDQKTLQEELQRLARLGIQVLETIKILRKEGADEYYLMDTAEKGKYILGYTIRETEGMPGSQLLAANQHDMKINQYAFAIRKAQPVSDYWHAIGFPEFSINHPELNDLQYGGKPANYELIQGWQRHGTVDFEWCIPVKTPIVYDDHIKSHGEGIHHLAFSVHDMDEVINDFQSRGYSISMSGAWGQKDKPGSGRFAYVDLESAGGVTMELLWNYQ